MRIQYKDVLTEDELSLISRADKNQKFPLYKDYNHPVLSKIITLLSNDFEFEVKSESYWRVESKPKGHDWHVDTGSNGHMRWCEVGATLLLNDDFTGGETLYKENGEEIEIERSVNELLAHTSDEEHKVNKSVGQRTVLLIFI